MPAKASGKEKRPPKRNTPAGAPPPQWPLLQPLVPTSDLALETLLDDQILVIRNLFTSTLCKNYVSFLASLPLCTTPGQPKKGDALRVNDRIQFDDAAFAERLWKDTGLKHMISGEGVSDDVQAASTEELKNMWGGDVCGLNPRIRIYRYCKGQFFAQHYDESNNLVLATDPPTSAKTTWTLLVYLTGPATGCVGGETVFYPELGQARKFSGKPHEGTKPIVVDLEVGMALLHRHGQDCLLHEGREVLDGEKWIIRSDLCVRR